MNDEDKPKAGETNSISESPTSDMSTNSGDAAQGSGKDAAKAKVKVKAKESGQAAVQAARETQENAAKAVSSVAQETKALASDIVGKAKESASEASERLLDAVEHQKLAGAVQVREVADAIQRAADALDEKIPQAARYVRLAAQELENASEAIGRRNVGEIFEVVQDFARRRPAAFLGATALAGFATVRFLMASGQRQERRSDANWGANRGAASERSGGSPSKTSESGAGSNWAAEVPVTSAPSTASGDPGGVSAQAPGFEAETGGAGEKKT